MSNIFQNKSYHVIFWVLILVVFSVSLITIISNYFEPACTENDLECHWNTVSKEFQSAGPDAAQDLLISLVRQKKIDESDCHNLAHKLGRAVILQLGNVEDSLNRAKSFCAAGYTHGLLEGFFGSLVVDGILNTEIDKVCASYAARRDRQAINCFHGLGHAILTTNNYNLPEALKLCDRYKNGWAEMRCYDGVFMENTENRTGTEFFRVSDPIFSCGIVSESYAFRCYWRGVPTQTITKTTIFDPSIPKLLSDIESKIPIKFRKGFWFGVGNQADVILQGDYVRVREFCAKLQPNSRKECLHGAALHVAIIDDVNKTSRAPGFCRELIEEERDSCEQSLLLLGHGYPEILIPRVR